MDEMFLAMILLIATQPGLLVDISEAATKYGYTRPVDQLRAFRQVWVESKFIPGRHREDTNCIGLMQINLDVWGPGLWETDHVANLEFGFRYMRELETQFGDYRKALAAYVWGPGKLSKHLVEYEDKWFKMLPLEVMNYLGAIAPVSEREYVWPKWAWWR